MSKRVAVIDVGSNSIKALVAEPDGSDFGVLSVWEGTREVRISTGISGSNPMLREVDIEAGALAVSELYQRCLEFGPFVDIRIVATSAVRSAANGQVFLDRVRNLTTVEPQLISGQEEADCIAMGVRSDPEVGGRYSKFTVFDLGGGSMELIRFVDNHVSERVSLPLGSVRLTEMFIRQPDKPVPETEFRNLSNHLRKSIGESGIRLEAPLIGCSGGLTIWRAIRAREAKSLSLNDSSSVFTEDDINGMITEVVHKDVQYRIESAKIPSQRADIFPVALITFKVLLEMFGTSQIQHSLHNLRYGVAWAFLQP